MRRFTYLIFLLLLLPLTIGSCQKNQGKKLFDESLVFWEQNRYEEAVQNLIILTKTYPDHYLNDDSLFWIANIYDHYLKKPEQAIRYYRLLNKKFETSDYINKSMHSLARIYLSQGDDGLRKALLIYQKLLKLDLTDDEWEKLQFTLAEIYFQLRYFEQGRVALKELLQKREDSDLVHKAYYLIGNSYYREGRPDLTELSFLEAEKKFNHSKKSLTTAISLANIYEEQGHLQSAIETYQTILDRLKPNEMFFQLALSRMAGLKARLKKTHTGLDY